LLEKTKQNISDIPILLYHNTFYLICKLFLYKISAPIYKKYIGAERIGGFI